MYGALIALLALGGRFLMLELGSEEDKILRRFEHMTQGFNLEDAGAVLAGFHDDYEDEDDRGYDRRRIRETLIYLFFRGGEERLRMELPEQELIVELAPEGESAQAGGRAVFWRARPDGTEELYWDARFRAELVDGAEGWQILRTFEVNHHERER